MTPKKLKQLKLRLNPEKKLRFRRYKKGKRWMYSTIATVGSFLGAVSFTTDAKADNLEPTLKTVLTAASGLSTEEDEDDSDDLGAKSMETPETAVEASALVNEDPREAVEIEAAIPTNEAIHFSAVYLTQTAGSIDVATDPDGSRGTFNQTVENNTLAQTPTSITVPITDTVANDVVYKAQAIANNTYAAVATWADFMNAYNNNAISYIDLIGNVSAGSTVYSTANASNNPLTPRTASLIIQGNNNILDLGINVSLFVGTAPAGSQLTLNNVRLMQEHTQGSSSSGSLRSVIQTPYLQAQQNNGLWIFNLNNVTYAGTASATTNGQYGNPPARLVDMEDALVNLSGNITWFSDQELFTLGALHIANGTTINYTQSLGSDGDSAIYFMAWDHKNSPTDTGAAHDIRIGDNTTMTFNGRVQGTMDRSVFYQDWLSMTVGDNVTWTQTAFTQLFNSASDKSLYGGNNGNFDTTNALYQSNGYGNLNSKQVVFGQNLTMNIPSVSSSTINIASPWNVTFNAGTTLNIKQTSNNPAFNLSNGAQLTFISPKALSVSINNGAAGNNFYNVSGAGTAFKLNNSSITYWNTANSNPATSSMTFQQLAITSSGLSIKDAAGNDLNSGLSNAQRLGVNTSSFQTTANPPGIITLEYVDINGVVIKTVQIPLSLANNNFIGQTINLLSQEYALSEIPENYMWAIGTQVLAAAAANAQSMGDPTSILDNGDSYGQANYAIVPPMGQNYTYLIYLYGLPNPGVHYQYLDVLTGNVVPTGSLQTGKEASGTSLSPANYGNTIDWTNSYYSSTNVPKGYVLASGELLGDNQQPNALTVGDGTMLATFYVYSPEESAAFSEEASEAASEELSDSESLEVSEHLSESESEDLSDSLSESESDSESSSGSASEAQSNVISESSSESTSDSLSNSLFESEQHSAQESNSESSSESMSESLSESLSEVESENGSLSDSESLSQMMSDSLLVSSSESDSLSLSDEESGSISESISTSHFESLSDSLSESRAESQNVSDLISESELASESLSQSEVLSTSHSESLLESASESLMESESLSSSESGLQSESTSVSDSESASLSESLSELEQLSESGSASESESHSVSEYHSLSDSLSEEASMNDSNSLLDSILTSESLSASESSLESHEQSDLASESSSLSESLSQSIEASLSVSSSLSLSESASESYSEAESGLLSASESMHESASESLSESTSLSEFNSQQESNSESSSESLSESSSESVSNLESLSVSESDFESALQSTYDSELISESESTSESVSLSEFHSQEESSSESRSESMLNSLSLVESASVSESESISLSLMEKESNRDSESLSESGEISESESLSLSNSNDNPPSEMVVQSESGSHSEGMDLPSSEMNSSSEKMTDGLIASEAMDSSALTTESYLAVPHQGTSGMNSLLPLTEDSEEVLPIWGSIPLIGAFLLFLRRRRKKEEKTLENEKEEE
jgi:hypothetical protein